MASMFDRPTFGLEHGGSYDRSVGEGELKSQLQIPAGTGQAPSEKMQIQGSAALAISDAVPRNPGDLAATLPAQTPAPDPMTEMFTQILQKNAANKVDWAALKEWLNKAGTGDEIEHAWNMFKAGGKDWYAGGIGRVFGGEGQSAYGPGGMKNRLEVIKAREAAQQSGEKK